MKTKCLSCQNIQVAQDSDGMIFRCGLGFFDTEGGTPVYHSASGLVNGTVALWKAEKKCGLSYKRRETFKALGGKGE